MEINFDQASTKPSRASKHFKQSDQGFLKVALTDVLDQIDDSLHEGLYPALEDV